MQTPNNHCTSRSSKLPITRIGRPIRHAISSQADKVRPGSGKVWPITGSGLIFRRRIVTVDGMDQPSVSASTLSQSQWNDLHARTGAAIQQSWAYGEALGASGVECRRYVATINTRPVAIAQCIIRRFGPFGMSLCARGPVWLEPVDEAQRTSTLKQLRRAQPLLWPSATIVSPDIMVSPGDALKIPGFRRVVSGYSTVRIDLSAPPDAIRAAMASKWRNRLAAAEAAPLRVEVGGTKPAQYAWLLDKEDLQRQERAYAGLPREFVDRYIAACPEPRSAALQLKAMSGNNPVAAMLFLRHGTSATYHIGWSNDLGRQHSAHNLILWRAIQALKEAGVQALDLGGVNTARSAGLARFKIGTGGQVQTFAGSYC